MNALIIPPRLLTDLDLTGTPATGHGLIFDGSLWAARALVVADISGAAPLASPALSGHPTGVTELPGDNSTRLASTAFVTAAVGAITVPVTSVAGRTGAVVLAKSDVGLSAVENTAMSTWAGSTALTTLGTIGTGGWNGTVIGALYGGTGQTAWTRGDLLYASAANTLAKRTIGASATYLRADGSDPSWAALAAADLTGTLADARLSANVPLLNAANVFTAGQQITCGGPLQVGLKIKLASLQSADALQVLASDGTTKYFSVAVTANDKVTFRGGTTSENFSFAAPANAIFNLNCDGALANRALQVQGNGTNLLYVYADTGNVNINTGVLQMGGTQVLTTRQAAVADATGAGDVVAQLNTLLARLRTHGLISA